MTRPYRVKRLVALAVLLTPGAAVAFDSAPTTTTHFRTLQPPPPPHPFKDGFFSLPQAPVPDIPPGDGGDSVFHVCARHGYEWDARDRFFQCWSPLEVQAGASKDAYSLSYMRYANRTPFYLQYCDGPDPTSSVCAYPSEITDRNDIDLDIGWVRVKRAWDGNGGEHRKIYELAAAAAGIPRDAVATFWVQYGASRRVLSSEMPDTNHLSVTGPSWLPVKPKDAQTVVARPVDALDLAQLPDTSHSLWDWAGGNELCPFDKLPFDDNKKVNLCHDFAAVMGAVNANHFLPKSRHYWTYYHQLALNQAARCNELATNLASLVTRRPEDDLNWEADSVTDFTTLNTEVHECERVAMLWEGIAQHYLQDAWSTGHMFRRWGTPELRDFPSEFSGDTPELLAKLTPADRQARQLLIADITAVYSGSIHGAKGVLDANLPATSHNNDPLCAPFWEKYVPNEGDKTEFTVHPRPTQWMDVGSDQAHQGAGDLFLAKILETPANEDLPGIGLKEQQSRLLGCTTGSAREVYAALPQWSGALGPLDLPDDVVLYNPHSDVCWKHWVTNESVNAGHNITFQGLDLGPFNIYTVQDGKQDILGPWTLNKIVTLIPGKLVGIKYDGPEDSGPLGLITPMDRLLEKASDDAQRDIENISLYFAEQAAEDAESGNARNNAAQQSAISFLGVKPGPDPLRFEDPPSSYADIPGSGLPQDELVPRMFPRAFLKETCQQGASIPSLKTRCKTTANGEGDAAACTMCIQLVKDWMQGCPRWDRAPREPSLCDAMGVTTGRPPQPILPEQYTNGADESDSMDRCTSGTKEILAEAYCTGWSDQFRDWCDTEVVSFDFKQEVPGYYVGTWLDEHVQKQNLCGQLGIDQHTDWDDRQRQQQAWLGRPYFGSVDIEDPNLGRLTPEFQRNDRGSPDARACGARQASVVARGTCTALYSGAGLTLPAGFSPGGKVFSDGKQDLFEVMGPIPRNTLEDLREPYCSARLPGLPSPADEQEFDLPTSSGILACPDGLKCQTDGYCRSEAPSLSVLGK